MVAKHLNPRTYQQGQWGNLAALIGRFGPTHGLTYNSFMSRQYKSGWPGLNGRKLIVVKEKPGTSSRAPEENTYSFLEMEEALRPTIISSGELILDGERRYTIDRAREKIGNPYFYLWKKWREDCDLIDEPITVYPSVVGVFPLKTCPAEQIDKLERRLAEAAKGVIDFKRKTYVAWKNAKRLLTHGRKLLIGRLSLCTHHQDICHKFSFSKKENWFLKTGLLQLRNRLLKKLAKKKARRPKKPEKKPRRKPPISKFSGIFKGKDKRRFSVRAAAKRFGIGRETLYQYLKEIPPDSGLLGLFPNNRLPAGLRLVPGPFPKWGELNGNL